MLIISNHLKIVIKTKRTFNYLAIWEKLQELQLLKVIMWILYLQEETYNKIQTILKIQLQHLIKDSKPNIIRYKILIISNTNNNSNNHKNNFKTIILLYKLFPK